MHTRNQDYGLVGSNRKSHLMTSSEIFEKRDVLWDKEWKIRSSGSDLARNQNFAKREGAESLVKKFGSDYFTENFQVKENKTKMRNIHPHFFRLLF